MLRSIIYFTTENGKSVPSISQLVLARENLTSGLVFFRGLPVLYLFFDATILQCRMCTRHVTELNALI